MNFPADMISCQNLFGFLQQNSPNLVLYGPMPILSCIIISSFIMAAPYLSAVTKRAEIISSPSGDNRSISGAEPENVLETDTVKVSGTHFDSPRIVV